MPANLTRTPGGLLWIAFTAFVGIAGLWSLFPVAALKFVGHLAGSLLICIVLVKAVRGRHLRAESAPTLALGTLVLAVLRWAFLPDYDDSADRLSSFVTAQAFAAFVAALYCILLFSNSKTWIRFSTLAALAIALVLNGSRIWGVSIILATILSFMFSIRSRNLKILVAVASCLALTVLYAFKEPALASIAAHSGTNRIADAITAFGSGDDRGAGLGTFRFRTQINELAISEIADSSPTQLIFGHGTSNGAAITASLFRNYSLKEAQMDPNRMLHNEWLRVIYEWGLLGSILWLGFVSSILVLAWKRLRLGSGDAAKALCVYFPGFLFALAGENILAGAGNVVNMGFLLVLALAYTPVRNASRKHIVYCEAMWAPQSHAL